MRLAGDPVTIDIAGGDALDAALESVPSGSGVFVLSAEEGEPYLGKTSLLRRRLKRVLGERTRTSKLLNLRSLVRRVEYWPAASQLEMNLVMYEAARRYVPDRYREFLKLRLPAYVRLVLSNEFPRTQVTTRLSSSPGVWYGPFRTRVGAEAFEHSVLDLFQLRRCQEDLAPSPDHPGCMYGEMNMCLRPCQQVVSAAEYASEAERVRDFLATGGKHLLEAAEHARDRFSAELEFEEAARWHRRAERIEGVLKQRDDIAADIDRLNGVAVLPSTSEESILLVFLLGGCWQRPEQFSVAPNAERAMSLDQRLRDLAAHLVPVKIPSREREEHLALFARWFFSTWRDGIWISFESLNMVPWRKLVSAVSRTAAAMSSTKL